VVGVAGLLGLLYFAAFCVGVEDEPGMELPWWVLACLAALVTGVLAAGVSQQAMHDRGRVERAVVAAVHEVDDSEGGISYAESLTDLAGRPIPGRVSDDDLEVGDHVTVTVDPRGLAPLHLGSRPPGSEGWWVLAAGLALLQSLTLALMGALSAAELALDHRRRRHRASPKAG
jgi:hypothetical protein